MDTMYCSTRVSDYVYCPFTVDCPDPSCSGHGSCVAGKCYCKAGWQGTNCSAVDQQVYQCLPGCSEHGSYDLEAGACVCDNYWAGPDCSQGMYALPVDYRTLTFRILPAGVTIILQREYLEVSTC
jgi:hypothetical protein